MEAQKWFGVRTVYEHQDLARGRDRLYEERVVLILAKSSEEALAKAEEEALSYSNACGETRFLGFLSGFEMSDSPGEDAEVFSLMRTSRMEPKRYLDAFFDTGRERSTTVE